MRRSITFFARNGMLRPKYLQLFGRYLWRRVLTRPGHRWTTAGPVVGNFLRIGFECL